MPFIYRYYSIQIISYVYLFVRGGKTMMEFFYSVVIIIFPVFFERVESDMWR